MINAGATIIAVFVTALVFYLIKRRRLNAHWDDMRYGILTQLVRFAVKRLNRMKPDERTWRPNILALSGAPQARWHLVEMAHSLTRHSSALTVASILPVEDWSDEKVCGVQETLRDYLEKREVDAMVKIFPSPDLLTGAKALVRAYGYGPLTPNTILIGDTGKRENFNEFAELIQLVYRTRRNLILLRDKDSDTGEHSDEIHVWWGGHADNIGLIITLACQIQKSPVWKQSKLIVKTIVDTEEEQTAARDRLEAYIEDQRIPAETDVMVRELPSFFDTIKASSAGAGLVFMGMRPPGEDESVDEYGRYYDRLMMMTEDMPTLALVLAAEPIEFRKVIGLAQMG
jgi:hypothetical protein